MKQQSHIFNLVWIFCIAFSITTDVCAQTFHHKIRSNSGNIIDYTNMQNGPVDAKGDFWDVKLDPSAPGNAVGKLKVKETRAYIKAYIDHDDPQIYEDYTYRFLVDVKGYKDPANKTQFDSWTDTLTLSYDPDSIFAYQDMHVLSYYGYQKLEVEIIDVYDWTCVFQSGPCTTPPSILTATPPQIATNWKIEVNVVDQKYDLEVSGVSGWEDAMQGSVLTVANTPPAPGDNMLTIHWEIENAIDYPDPAMCELEWIYVDDYKLQFEYNKPEYSGNPQLSAWSKRELGFDFSKNATRIITNKFEYQIPLIYKRGYLIYRVRLIRPDDADYRYNIYNAWSIPNNKGNIAGLTEGNNYYTIGSGDEHLADEFNWNYQASYAEDGKSKSLLTYYDGMLKNRQTVTKINTLPEVEVVSETYYNHEGKPSLQTLPIPVIQSGLQFIDNFAYPSGSSTEYTASNIDPINPTPLQALDAQSPAANYYSPDNTLYNSGGLGWNYLRGLPDAEGYPLIHTKYASEDGRVIAQGGAGTNLQLGSGHETQTYYLPADQTELDKYLGYDGGMSPFYEKIITKDPNKQLSFSVVNNKGQTMLSGLMGYPAISNPNSPLLMPDGVPTPIPSSEIDDNAANNILYGQKGMWSGNVRKYNIPKFFETTGNVEFDYSIEIPHYQPCVNTYLNVPFQFDIKLINEYGQPLTIKSEPFGDEVYEVANVPSSLGNYAAYNPITVSAPSGKGTIMYELSYNPEDVEKVVNDLLFPPPSNDPYNPNHTPTPTCLKSEASFVADELAKIEPCVDEVDGNSDKCTDLREQLKSELYPHAKYGKYFLSGSSEVTNTGNGSTFSGLFEPDANHGYKYRAYLRSNSIPDRYGYNRLDLADMPVREFIENFNDDFAEMLIGFHPEYCAFIKTNIDCNGDEFARKLTSILSIKSTRSFLEFANVMGFYPEGQTDPFYTLISKDPLSSEIHSNLGLSRLSKVKVYYPDASGGGRYSDERIDRVVFTKIFCANDNYCRTRVMYLYSQQDILNEVLKSSVEMRNLYFSELVNAYLANRGTVLEKEKAYRLANVTCNNPANAMTANQVIAPAVVRLMYADEDDELPKSEFTGSTNSSAISGMFSNSASTTQANIKNTLLNTSSYNGYSEYADAIIKKLANCRTSSGTFNTTTLHSALVSSMNSNDEINTDWKGGLTPDILSGILTGMGIQLDDLCNPYLVDYLEGPIRTIADNPCRESQFYSDLNYFLHIRNNSTIISEAIWSGNNSSISTGASLQTPFESNNKFEYELVSRLYGASAFNLNSNTQSNAAISVKVVNDVTNRIITLFFYKTGDFSFSNSVSISLTFNDKTNSSFNYTNLEYTASAPSGATQTCVVGFGGTTNCGSSVSNVQNSIPVVLNLACEFSDFTLTGTIRGLNMKTPNDQDQCITCVEIKKRYDDFMTDVQYNYDIKGKNHPFYEDALRSYMNFKFKKTHTSKEYEDLLKGCDYARFNQMPQYYAYGYASNTDTVELNKICTFIKNYGNGKYKDFNHFYYFKTDGSNNITEGKLYIDFNSFYKNDLRNIKEWLSYSGYNSTIYYNLLQSDYNISGTDGPFVFADLFVHHTPGAPNGPNPCSISPGGNQATLDQNWVPNFGVLNGSYCNNPSNGVDYVASSSYTGEVVTVKSNYMLSPYMHYKLTLPTNNMFSHSDISTAAYKYESSFLPDNTRSFRSFSRFNYTAGSQILNDSKKKDYLNYVYTKTCPADGDDRAKSQLIKELQPEALRVNINGTTPYQNNYWNFYEVTYLDGRKRYNSGDLYVQNLLSGAAIEKVGYWLERTKDNSQGNKYFPTYAEFDHADAEGNHHVSVTRSSDNIIWYNILTEGSNHQKNIWLKFPDYFPTDNHDVSDLLYDLNSAKMVITDDNMNHFTIGVYKTAQPYHPGFVVYGKTDFRLSPTSGAEVYRNVMLCPDAASADIVDFSCQENKVREATDAGKQLYKSYIDEFKRTYITGLKKHIEDNIQDQLWLRMPQSTYAVTMYGYDRAGNLAYTASPEAVKPWWDATANTSLQEDFREYREGMPKGIQAFWQRMPDAVKYTYNTKNKVIIKETAESGITYYYYDELARLIASENAQQRQDGKCSYIFYDKQGRVVETGTVLASEYLKDIFNKIIWNYGGSSNYETAVRACRREDVVMTYYDQEKINLSAETGMSKQDFLRNRVAAIAHYKSIVPLNDVSKMHDVAIHYSYDLGGNVKTLTYEMPGLKDVHQQFKRIDYHYDLYSGKVNLVSYNRSFADQYFQRYVYDADNRIEKVETSMDGIIWDIDAQYKYYPHGPLARMQLGQLGVQGLDYVYTLQGWLKSINGDTPDPEKDFGADEYDNSNIQRDLLRKTLYYFNGDFKPIDEKDQTNAPGTSIAMIPDLDQGSAVQSLYNGNIAASVTMPGYFPSLYANYTYDQLNRIKSASYLLPDYTATNSANVLREYNATNFNTSTTIPSGINTEDVYKTSYKYDLDGNITELERYSLLTNSSLYDYTGGTVYKMDDLKYHYRSDRRLLNNVEDFSTHAVPNVRDIPSYTNPSAASIYRLDYDFNGNMIKDDAGAITSIKWNGNGKPEKVVTGPAEATYFGYDPLGNRFRKTVKDDAALTELDEYYIREASGNILAIYKRYKKYKMQAALKDIIDVDFGGHSSIKGDIAQYWGQHSSFIDGMVKGLTDLEPEFTENTVANYDLAFYLNASAAMLNGVVSATPDLVSHVMANRPALITDPLTAEYDQQFFAPLLYETNDIYRLEMIDMLVDSTDTVAMDSIINAMFPGAYIANKEAFITAFDYAQKTLPAAQVNAALQQHLTGTVRQAAVNRLLASSTFMNTAVLIPGHTNMEEYLIDIVAHKADRTDLQTYYTTDRTDGDDLLSEAATVEDKLRAVYADDVNGFIDNVFSLTNGLDVIDLALNQVEGMGATAFLDGLLEQNPGDQTYQAYAYNRVLEQDKTWLAEHVLYGSSRLGLKVYWPTQYTFEFDATKSADDNRLLLEASAFHYRRGWYAQEYNGLIKANETNLWGNAFDGKVGATRILGLKRYELNNHLGNVQAVITDKITVGQNNLSASRPTTDISLRPSLFATYDYYPFGMLMPERSVQDANQQCIPTVRTAYAKKAVPIITFPNDPSHVAAFTPDGNTTVSFVDDPTFEVTIQGNAGGGPSAFATIPDGNLDAGMEFEFNTLVAKADGNPAPMHVWVGQDDGMGGVTMLAQSSVQAPTLVTLTATAINNNPLLIYYERTTPGTGMYVQPAEYKVFDKVLADIITVDCNTEPFEDNGYRFGFNGQMKDDNLKGPGNSLDFTFRTYDPRLGRFLSLDPLSESYPWYTPYQFAGNTPIMAVDLEGGEPQPYLAWENNVKKHWYGKPAIFTVNGIMKVSDRYESLKKSETWRQMGIGIGNTMQMFNRYDFSEERAGMINNTGNNLIHTVQQMPDWGAAEWGQFTGDMAFAFVLDRGVGLILKVVRPNQLWLGKVGYGADYATVKSLNNLTPKRGWFDVVIHGDDAAPGLVFQDGMTAEQLLEYMVENGYNGTDRIRLISCHAGNGGKSSLAQELADLSGNQVIAPTDKTRVLKGGKLDTKDGEKYKVFEPQKTE